MFVGHYGPSFAAKRVEPSIPLWVLFIAVQFLDVLWAPFVLLGIEKVRIDPGVTATSPLDLYYMPYTHSLLGALVWSVVGGLVYHWIARPRSVRPGLIVGAAVFSHWVLDLLVHRPDLPLFGNSMKVGLGLWNHPILASVLEVAVLLAGIWLYYRGRFGHTVGIVIFAVVMLAVQASVFFGPPPTSDHAIAWTALASYALFAMIIGWVVDRRPAGA